MVECEKPLYFWQYVAYGDNECPRQIVVRFINFRDGTEHECSPSLWNRFMAKLWKQHGEGSTAKINLSLLHQKRGKDSSSKGEKIQRSNMPLNKPGVRRKGNGVVIQFETRAKQLSDISDAIVAMTPNNGSEPVTLDAKTARTLWGYAQQIGIVADELSR